jgi:hypothetical protein
MIKKLLKMATIGVAALGLAGTAGAATYKVNMCGASAQADFWITAGEAVVQSTFNCASAVLDGTDDKNMVVEGLSCDAGLGTAPDTIYVRYNASNSAGGCAGFNGAPLAYADPATCTFDGTPYDCTGTESADCMMGCADVPCSTLKATSIGYTNAECSGSPTSFGNAAGYDDSAATDFYLGVIVPFGFIVNNNVTDYVCTEPDVDDLAEGQHLAYDKEGWECDPRLNENGTENVQCRGDWKCIDVDQDGVGVCLDGTQSADLLTGTPCVDASDCKIPASMTSCEPRTLKNISRLMALHIFSNAVDNWQDFGPGFPDLAIVKCMRHGGSGTHQTLIDQVFRGDATVANFTNCFPAEQGAPGDENKSYVLHYKSSSDLTQKCVAKYAGGIGYVDADKVMFRSKIGLVEEPVAYAGTYGVSQLMYQGVAPSRLAVSQGKYNFWAAQQCFANANRVPADEKSILDAVMAGAADPDSLIFADFGQKAFFWATGGEMRVTKTPSVLSFPTRTFPDPGFPGVDPGPFPTP